MWLLLVPALIYGAILVLLFVRQTDMLFPVGQVPAAGAPPNAERLTETSVSGDRLEGLRVPPAEAGATRTLILGFGGNASNAAGVAAMLHALYPAADIVVFHYRGYPPSGGRPDAAALREDALLIHDRIRERLRPQQVIAVGFSVGGGIAAALAAARPLDGLILVTPFDSLGEVAAGHYPWLPVRLLFHHRLEPARDLAGSRLPVAILAGGRDMLVLPARTDRLRRSIPNLVYDRTIPEAGHNDIYAHPAFDAVMTEAYQRVISTSMAR